MLSRSAGPLSVAFVPTAGAGMEVHVTGVAAAVRPVRMHRARPFLAVRDWLSIGGRGSTVSVSFTVGFVFG